jgi:cyclic pyranopterin phosphate synthase
MDELTHIDKSGNPQMVNVSGKNISSRKAIARSIIKPGSDVLAQLQDGEIKTKKGPVFHTAIIAGTMGAKETAQLIPFCHPLPLNGCDISIEVIGDKIEVTCTTSVDAKTGVEMEALTGASIAALTIYDMCKAISHDIVIEETRLIHKSGGKSEFNYSENG